MCCGAGRPVKSPQVALAPMLCERKRMILQRLSHHRILHPQARVGLSGTLWPSMDEKAALGNIIHISNMAG